MNVLKILKKQGVGLGLTLISILIIVFFHRMHVFDSLENKIYDLGFRVRGPLSGWAAREPIPKKAESFTDLNNNGLWDKGEEYTDSNENGKWDKGLDVVIVDLDQKSYENVPWSWPYTREVWAQVVRNLAKAGARAVVFDFQFDAPDRLAEEPVIKGIRDELLSKGLGELLPTHGDSAFAKAIREAQEMGTAVILASKIDYNSLERRYELVLPNDVIMSPEPFTDLNENKQYDKAEEFEDLNSNGEWSYFDGSVDTVFDAFDNVIATYEFDNNGLFDYYDYGTDGIEGEPYTDTSGNGHWDFGEPFEDLDGNFQCTGCDLDGSEGNGYFDEGEPAEGHELWTDANDNGLWDKAEEFEDQNGNNSWDAEPPLTALVDEIQDPDGSTRRYYAFNRMRDDPDTWYLTMAMRSAKEFLNFPPDSLMRLGGDPEKGIIWFEDIEIPTYSETSTFYVNYYGPPSAAQTGGNDPWGTFDSYSLFQVVDVAKVVLRDTTEDTNWMDFFINPENDLYFVFGPDESPFRDKVVLIGISVEIFHDTKRTPYFSFAGEQKLMPGVEVHANALQTIIDKNFINMYGGDMEWSDKSWISHVILIAILAFIAYILLAFMNPLFAGLSILVELLIFISIAVGSFTNDSLWLVKLVFGSWDSIDIPGIGESTYVPVVASIFGVFTTYITNVLYRFIVEQKDKRFLKSTFGTYVSPELIDRMYEEHQEPKLGGEAGYHTAFFSDIQSFSSFTEVMEPQRMVALMNEYLTEMTDILLARHGTLDKYIGDAIVAFYGAPVPVEDHEYQACLTALEMETGIAKLREKWASEEDWPDLVHNLRHRVGLSTGDMVTGNMGSNMRMNYTMMGDTVNTAARLEASAKQYGVYIQVSEFTYEPVKDKFEWRTLDYVRVKGKTVPVRTYELLAEKGKLAEGKSKLVDTFHEGLELYYNQKWDKALKAFKNADELEDMFPMRPSNPSRVYIERCKYLKENPPGTDWDKVWTLTQK